MTIGGEVADDGFDIQERKKETERVRRKKEYDQDKE